MSLEHDKEALAAFVVGALAPDERAEMEAHLAGCAACAAEARSLQHVAGALGRGVPQRTPPPELRARVLAAVGADGARPARARPAGLRAFAWSDPRVWASAAAMLLVAAGLAAYTASLQSRIVALESRLEAAAAQAAEAERATLQARRVADEAQSAMAVLAAPDLTRIDLAGEPAAPAATARALWSRQRGMVFTASNLPAPPPGRVYQVWVVTAEGPVSAGLLEPDAAGRGMRVFDTPPDIAAPVAVAVTLEPAGGVPAPTGERYLIGTPAAI